MVDKNDALFREIDEELRREQFAKIWERFGIYIIGLAVLIVALVAGAKIWEAQRLSNGNAAGAEFEAAVALQESNKTEDALKAFEALAAHGPKGYAALASLSQAGAYLKLDKPSEALAVFDKLAGDAATDPLLANFARLQAASLRLGEADFTEMENRLKPLVADNSPWRFTARELLGTAAIKAGKLDEARGLLAPLLADPGLSRGASDRIHLLMSKIATDELAGAPPASAPVATEAAPAAGADAAKDAEKPASAP
ncbi:tetratricopeptide repeat protein [Hyphomicrobium sp.]|uniref:tetratricopeptide repeat protein n=1 Tax=Hyphomicrobium sp. TaxID=82 RepID=UPI0025C0CD83|nr:tetratricopeptide repeat protein [Hyphomicrobium sp.]MCC7250604.1 tetratricopeptide repeat protein [Hyphomicrobium sp.]